MGLSNEDQEEAGDASVFRFTEGHGDGGDLFFLDMRASYADGGGKYTDKHLDANSPE